MFLHRWIQLDPTQTMRVPITAKLKFKSPKNHKGTMKLLVSPWAEVDYETKKMTTAALMRGGESWQSKDFKGSKKIQALAQKYRRKGINAQEFRRMGISAKDFQMHQLLKDEAIQLGETTEVIVGITPVNDAPEANKKLGKVPLPYQPTSGLGVSVQKLSGTLS